MNRETRRKMASKSWQSSTEGRRYAEALKNIQASIQQDTRTLITTNTGHMPIPESTNVGE